MEDRLVAVQRSTSTVLAASEATRSLGQAMERRRTYEETLWRLLKREKQQAKPDEELLARYLLLRGPLERVGEAGLYETAQLGLAAYESDFKSVAEDIVNELRFQTSASAALGEVLHGLVTFIKRSLWAVAAFGLLFLATVVFVYVVSNELGLAGSVSSASTLFSTALGQAGHIILAFLFGGLGSVVSILLRLGEFEAMRGKSKQFLYYTGFTLPIIGAAFGAVIGAVLAAQVISIRIGEFPGGSQSFEVYMVVGFLAGFSERFSRGVLKALEGTSGARGAGSAVAGQIETDSTVTSRQVHRQGPATADRESAADGDAPPSASAANPASPDR
ncbi:hypothetical protein [Antarcticirhabdus aurantiaca]|uniref:Uncharacterized protein n=1 Tax=Antarcticirhabdus aurantiaca TaxID=2606717 RepID=A0ACD4NNL0_9HYPH|nr:hypothetical protein [Antarcticirhabdus aurantiaca]WAJ28333.1 hypothetical protein OXU80_26560 [Jeongeuplla avenae]